MNKLLSALVMGFACIALLLSSCEKNDPPPSDEWRDGYFKGTVNGRFYHIPDRKFAGQASIWYDGLQGSIEYVSTYIDYQDGYELIVTLHDVAQGKRTITENSTSNIAGAASSISIFDSRNNVEIEYIPMADDPVELDIFNFFWRDPITPIIEVKIDGTLYNSKNPEDTITIDAMYGTR